MTINHHECNAESGKEEGAHCTSLTNWLSHTTDNRGALSYVQLKVEWQTD
jgi:hypothetical protein